MKLEHIIAGAIIGAVIGILIVALGINVPELNILIGLYSAEIMVKALIFGAIGAILGAVVACIASIILNRQENGI